MQEGVIAAALSAVSWLGELIAAVTAGMVVCMELSLLLDRYDRRPPPRS